MLLKVLYKQFLKSNLLPKRHWHLSLQVCGCTSGWRQVILVLNGRNSQGQIVYHIRLIQITKPEIISSVVGSCWKSCSSQISLVVTAHLGYQMSPRSTSSPRSPGMIFTHASKFATPALLCFSRFILNTRQHLHFTKDNSQSHCFPIVA